MIHRMTANAFLMVRLLNHASGKAHFILNTECSKQLNVPLGILAFY
jgi:hypothetical protein